MSAANDQNQNQLQFNIQNVQNQLNKQDQQFQNSQPQQQQQNYQPQQQQNYQPQQQQQQQNYQPQQQPQQQQNYQLQPQQNYQPQPQQQQNYQLQPQQFQNFSPSQQQFQPPQQRFQNSPPPQQQFQNSPPPQQQFQNSPPPQQQFQNSPPPQQQFQNSPPPQQQFQNFQPPQQQFQNFQPPPTENLVECKQCKKKIPDNNIYRLVCKAGHCFCIVCVNKECSKQAIEQTLGKCFLSGNQHHDRHGSGDDSEDSENSDGGGHGGRGRYEHGGHGSGHGSGHGRHRGRGSGRGGGHRGRGGGRGGHKNTRTSECSAEFNEKDYLGILSDANKAIFNRFKKFLIAIKNQNNHSKFCIRCYNIVEDKGDHNSRFLFCGLCDSKICSFCLKLEHGNSMCYKAEKKLKEHLEFFLKEKSTRVCPSCGIHPSELFRYKMNNILECTKCSTNWCYKCGKILYSYKGDTAAHFIEGKRKGCHRETSSKELEEDIEEFLRETEEERKKWLEKLKFRDEGKPAIHKKNFDFDEYRRKKK